MATLAPPSPTSPSRRRRKTCIRRCERVCWTTITHFPLLVVCGLTTWAVVLQRWMSLDNKSYAGLLGLILYILLNWSYTTAVFTDPGSPHSPGTSILPSYKSVTAKSNGELRHCKKCHYMKPDRAHHCSTCNRCVLKMDHHCPWLATCVGFRNYKPFLLFLIYVTLFCWVCFGISLVWIYANIIESNGILDDSLMPVNFILLGVLSGIIGLVIGGFTAYHIYLTLHGRTTLEAMEKVRYMLPLKQQMSSQHHYADPENPTLGEHLRDFRDTVIETHANALPGVLRPEEGEERSSPAQSSLQRTRDWDEAERRRERDRYAEYLDEQDSEKLPNAFDLGRDANWRQVMGANPWLWFLPVINCQGDGWTWPVSSAWREASDRLAQKRAEGMQRAPGTTYS